MSPVKSIVALGVALATGSTAPAQAQRIVYDPANFAQAVMQVASLSQQLSVMQQQYQQLMLTYQSIAHQPQGAVNQLGQQLNIDQFRNALPAQGSVLGSVMNGSSLGSGSLAATAQTHFEQNRIHAPTAHDFQALEMQRNARSVAGAQAMASELYQSAANRITTLRAIEMQLASAPDTKAVADLQARIAAEQAYIQAQQVQVQSLAMWQGAQERNRMQRGEEERRRQIDKAIEAIKARGG